MSAWIQPYLKLVEPPNPFLLAWVVSVGQSSSCPGQCVSHQGPDTLMLCLCTQHTPVPDACRWHVSALHRTWRLGATPPPHPPQFPDNPFLRISPWLLGTASLSPAMS